MCSQEPINTHSFSRLLFERLLLFFLFQCLSHLHHTCGLEVREGGRGGGRRGEEGGEEGGGRGGGRRGEEGGEEGGEERGEGEMSDKKQKRGERRVNTLVLFN